MTHFQSFQQDYCITLYSIHVLLKLEEGPRLHSTAPSNQKSSRVRTVTTGTKFRMQTDKLRSATGSNFLLVARENCGRELLVVSCI